MVKIIVENIEYEIEPDGADFLAIIAQHYFRKYMSTYNCTYKQAYILVSKHINKSPKQASRLVWRHVYAKTRVIKSSL